jgi:FAD synthase
VLTLRELSAVAGLDGVEVGTVEVAGAAVSATRIRASLASGDVELVHQLLGRPYEVAGRPHVLGPGIPSLSVPAARAVPAPGRYVGSFRQRAGAPAVAAAIGVDTAVAVDASEGGRHHLTVHCDSVGPGSGRPATLTSPSRSGLDDNSRAAS